MFARHFLLVVASLTLLGTALPARAEFHAVDPCRVLDTRQPGEGPAIVGGSVRAINVRGLCGIPVAATSVTLNVTVLAKEAPGYAVLFRADRTVPKASTINFRANDVRNNMAVVKLGQQGVDIAAFVQTNPRLKPVHLILDVTGYNAGSLVGVTARLLGENFTAERWTSHGNGTASDRLTGLQWELKTKDGGIHDWGGAEGYEIAAMAFIGRLNTSPCFAGYCDWRLPTVDELQSITEPGYPSCTSAPCTTIPGPTASGPTWTSTGNTSGGGRWVVDFSNAYVQSKAITEKLFMRAVRGGDGS